MTRSVLMLGLLLSFASARAEKTIKMFFNNEDVTKILETYSKASGQKFVVDPSVRGKASIFTQEAVSAPEAFNLLSSALSVNGFAISKQGDTMVVRAARNIQRDLIEVVSERPALKPERMVVWVYTVKNLSAADFLRELRMLPSKDGETGVNAKTNQVIFTDWTSNLNRIADILDKVDRPVDASVSKLIQASEKKTEGQAGQKPRFRKDN